MRRILGQTPSHSRVDASATVSSITIRLSSSARERVPSRHWAPTGCGGAVAACRRWLLGMALDIMRPGAGARDPGLISPGLTENSRRAGFLRKSSDPPGTSLERRTGKGNGPMARPHSGGVVRLIQRLWDAGTVASMDDAELLGRSSGPTRSPRRRSRPWCVGTRDGVRVCRDVTGDPHDAEDAAQVTSSSWPGRPARSARRDPRQLAVRDRPPRRRPCGPRRGPPSPSRAAIRRVRRGAMGVGGARAAAKGVGRVLRGAGPSARSLSGADCPVRPGGPDPRAGRRRAGLSAADASDPALPRPRTSTGDWSAAA